MQTDHQKFIWNVLSWNIKRSTIRTLIPVHIHHTCSGDVFPPEWSRLKMAARCSQKRKNCGECVCRLGKTFLKPADPVFHSTHASNYDSRKIQTIATSNSEHHNRFGSAHPHRDWSENKTNQYYWVHANVITDDYHNGMMPHTASWMCGTGSTARVRRYVSFLTTNQCYARTLEAGMSGFHAVWCAIPESCGRTAPPADAMPSCNPSSACTQDPRGIPLLFMLFLRDPSTLPRLPNQNTGLVFLHTWLFTIQPLPVTANEYLRK